MIPERSQNSQARSGSPASGGPDVEPLLSITRGNPTAEELAAVTAVVLALRSGGEAAPKAPTRQWIRRAQLHLPPRPGAGSWRRSAH